MYQEKKLKKKIVLTVLFNETKAESVLLVKYFIVKNQQIDFDQKNKIKIEDCFLKIKN